MVRRCWWIKFLVISPRRLPPGTYGNPREVSHQEWAVACLRLSGQQSSIILPHPGPIKLRIARQRQRLTDCTDFLDDRMSNHSGLLRWTLDISIGTEDATISWLRPQYRVTIYAFMKKLTSVCRHLSTLRGAAIWACQFGSGDYDHGSSNKCRLTKFRCSGSGK